MQDVDHGVIGEVRAHLGTAVDDGEIAGSRQRSERLLDVRSEPGVDRMHLEDDDQSNW